MPNRSIPVAGEAMPGLPQSPRRRRAPLPPAALRARLEAAADRIIAALDALDLVDEDREDQGDDEEEPDEDSLGAPENSTSAWWPIGQTRWAQGGPDDLELDDSDLEDDGTSEPDLGASEHHPLLPTPWSTATRTRDGSQARWSQGTDREHSDVTQEGDELDTLEGDNGGMGHGCVDDEPALGATEDFDQVKAWADAADWAAVMDGEEDTGDVACG